MVVQAGRGGLLKMLLLLLLLGWVAVDGRAAESLGVGVLEGLDA
jgi:hypothetical protein